MDQTEHTVLHGIFPAYLKSSALVQSTRSYIRCTPLWKIMFCASAPHEFRTYTSQNVLAAFSKHYTQHVFPTRQKSIQAVFQTCKVACFSTQSMQIRTVTTSLLMFTHVHLSWSTFRFPTALRASRSSSRACASRPLPPTCLSRRWPRTRRASQAPI
jgi:hypothetical protein